MGKLWIAGLGPGNPDLLTLETKKAMEQADAVILRTGVHPAVAGLKSMGIRYRTCDRFYEQGESFAAVYAAIADHVMAEAAGGKAVCYCVPGHPRVAEDTVELLLQKARVSASAPEIRVLAAVSFLDAAFVSLGIDPLRERLCILDAAGLHSGSGADLLPLPRVSCLFAQVYDPFVAGDLKLALLEEIPPDAEISILYHVGIEGKEAIIRCPLAELDHFKQFDHLTSVYLPFPSTE